MGQGLGKGAEQGRSRPLRSGGLPITSAGRRGRGAARSVASALVIPGGSIPRRRDSRRATTDCAPVRPAPARRSATSSGHRPRLGCAPTLREWLDGVSDALCISPPRLRDSRPFATAAIRSRLRLPGTTGPRVRSPWPAAEVQYTVTSMVNGGAVTFVRLRAASACIAAGHARLGCTR